MFDVFQLLLIRVFFKADRQCRMGPFQNSGDFSLASFIENSVRVRFRAGHKNDFNNIAVPCVAEVVLRNINIFFDLWKFFFADSDESRSGTLHRQPPL